MENEQNCNIPITNSSKLVYDLICEAIGSMTQKNNRKFVIYGAGSRGCLIAKLMKEKGIQEFYFCDRNKAFLDKHINQHTFITISELFKNHNRYFTIISPEDSKQIKEFFEIHGLKANLDYVCLGGNLYQDFYDKLKETQQKGILFLGDCDMLSFSLLEKERICLDDILKEKFRSENTKENYKSLNMNSITMGGFYWSYKANKALGNINTHVFILVDMRNFNGITNYLPSTQHTELWESIKQIAEIDGFSEYINFTAERQKSECRFQKAQGYGDRTDIINRNYIRFNYCYNLKPYNEEIEYLSKLLKEIKEDGATAVLLFNPVNYEVAERYCPKKFKEYYCRNKTELINIVSEYEPYVLDLSFSMNASFFLAKDTYDECLCYDGKTLVADKIYKAFTNISKN